ncbi:transposase [Streptomyces sp. NPDC087300]|uniref:transposase n=1 Tax=Streptomyces sp. NPDC087300 TaxID=3365780 RepID=UPI00380C3284
MAEESQPWVMPAGLWCLARPLLPPPRLRFQNGVRQNLEHADVFAAVVYVRGYGRTWRDLSPAFGVSRSTAQHRFRVWSRFGVWDLLHQAVLASPHTQEFQGLTQRLLDASPGHSGVSRGQLVHVPEQCGPFQEASISQSINTDCGEVARTVAELSGTAKDRRGITVLHAPTDPRSSQA